MDNNYLIPANTKRGQLVLGLFYWIDIFIFGGGLLVSFLLMSFLPIDRLSFAILALTPGVICGLLVLPVAYYHNVRQLIVEIYKYFSQRRNFVWKGWCFLDESSEKSK